MKTIALSLLLVASTGIIDLPNITMPSIHRTTAAMPSFDWAETTFDFGKIKQNTPVTHEFRFVNNGGEPLLISSVQASCGCTVAKYSKDPIAPGAAGFVTATYNAATKGVFTKTITVNANTKDGVVVLSVRGEVQ
jgi:hypothetical protein